MLSASAHDIRKARALMAWADLAAARAGRAEACKAPYETFRRRMEGMEDAEMTWLGELTGKLCGAGGRWEGVQGSASYASGGNVTLGKVVTSGAGLPEGTVEAVLRRYRYQIQYCYQRELMRTPSLAGTGKIRFTIDKTGAVTEAKLSGTVGTTALAGCLEGRFQRMMFTKPSQKVVVTPIPGQLFVVVVEAPATGSLRTSSCAPSGA
jgi:hypothetical protein